MRLTITNQVSNCCNANLIHADICSKCKEHCLPIIIEETEVKFINGYKIAYNEYYQEWQATHLSGECVTECFNTLGEAELHACSG